MPFQEYRTKGWECSCVLSHASSCEVGQRLQKTYRKRQRYETSSKSMRNFVMWRDKGICVYCGAQATTLDHVIPVSKGGQTTRENLVAACFECNQAKGDKILQPPS